MAGSIYRTEGTSALAARSTVRRPRLVASASAGCPELAATARSSQVRALGLDTHVPHAAGKAITVRDCIKAGRGYDLSTGIRDRRTMAMVAICSALAVFGICFLPFLF